MQKNEDYKKVQLSKDWKLTIFGKQIQTPRDLLPINHPESPHYERHKKDSKR